jgi:Fumarase C C-terminus.
VILEMELLSPEEIDQILSPENLSNPRYRGKQLS